MFSDCTSLTDLFRSTGSYEPDQVTDAKNTDMERFRSTGSYEPDPVTATSTFDDTKFRSTGSYEPDPVTATSTFDDTKFRSTGSYEPDPHWDIICKDIKSFDPQALTSLTDFYLYPCHITSVSIHRLLRA